MLHLQIGDDEDAVSITCAVGTFSDAPRQVSERLSKAALRAPA